MFDFNFVRNILREHVDRGADKFIIYPFGANGFLVKNILKEYFGLGPIAVVDNVYEKYNSAIISRDTLKKIYCKDMYIIITVEDDVINAELENTLIEFVPFANIINLAKEKKAVEKREKDEKEEKEKLEKEKLESIAEGFRLRKILPYFPIVLNEKKQSHKIKVRIVHSNCYFWNAIRTICKAFCEDLAFDVLIIIGALKEEKTVNQVREEGYHYLLWDDYQIEDDKPDVLLLSHPWDYITNLSNCRKYTKLIVAVPLQINVYEDSLEKFWEVEERGFSRFCPDYYLYDSLVYRELRNSKFFSPKIVEMGNAKFDGIYMAMQKKEYVGGWKKLKGCTTVCWTPSHGVLGLEVHKRVTFDLYAKTFFQYANSNPEMGFIFRPHKAFIGEMLHTGFWSEPDVEKLLKYCSESPNIVFDDTDTYDTAFSIADGVLTDAYSGIMCSALPTLKPICIAYRSRENKQYHEDLVKKYYSAYENEDIIDFFEMLKKKEDPMFELRRKASSECVKNFDGKNGWRIKEFIKEKYYEMI